MAEEPRVFLFEFRGEARTLEQGEESEVVFFLNDSSGKIAQEIQQEVRRALPVGVYIETLIRFYQGSIAWEGAVIILDWMARLAGAAEFISILSRVVKIAIERVIQRWLSSRNQTPFPLRVTNPIQVEITFQTSSGYSGESAVRRRESMNAPRTLLLLTAVNTLLLLIVLVVQIILR